MSYNPNAFPSESGIYQIVNLITEKRYIGYASNLRTRWNGHLHDLITGKHGNEILQRVWNKYGKENFEFRVLQLCSREELCLLEDYWVKVLKTENREYGYNIRPTDPNGIAGHSEATIQKLKNAGTGRSRFGKDNHFFGHKITEIHKEKMRISRLHIDYTQLHRKKRGKKVINVITGEIHGSLAEVCEIIRMTKGSLSRILLGKRKNKTNFKYVS